MVYVNFDAACADIFMPYELISVYHTFHRAFYSLCCYIFDGWNVQ